MKITMICLLIALASVPILAAKQSQSTDEWANFPTYDTFPLYARVGYDQALRPQFHFTSRVGWINDPNGMVYYDGEWHLCFQHHAKGNASGIKSWGNAVSTDLMHWTQLPHAINPYPNVMNPQGGEHGIWSGSAVVDENNALAKQKGDVKTLFALFTATYRDEKTNDAAFFQSGAYSADKGRTWTIINGGKPIIEHQEGFPLRSVIPTCSIMPRANRIGASWKSAGKISWSAFSNPRIFYTGKCWKTSRTRRLNA